MKMNLNEKLQKQLEPILQALHELGMGDRTAEQVLLDAGLTGCHIDGEIGPIITHLMALGYLSGRKDGVNFRETSAMRAEKDEPTPARVMVGTATDGESIVYVGLTVGTAKEMALTATPLELRRDGQMATFPENINLRILVAPDSTILDGALKSVARKHANATMVQ